MRFTFLFATALLALTASAEDIETLKHEIYKGATISRVEPDGIVITYSAGIVKIPFDELPDSYKQRYGYDVAKAREFSDSESQKQELLYRQTQEERQRVNTRAAAIAARNEVEVRASDKARAIAGFSLDARETGTNDSYYETWRTDYGSYDRKVQQQKKIIVMAHDTGGSTAICRVKVYFVGHSMTANLHFVYACVPADLNVVKGAEAKATITAPAIDSRVLNLAALGVQYGSGIQMEGWIATGEIEGQRFGLACSQQVVCHDAEPLIAEYNARNNKSASPAASPEG
ncbi:MAG: hypothetical protein JO354_06020 [Verrucomicrobia bacterium]|nr:hypothetical protein [Verrucomicrobiota bacterium]